VGLLQNEMKTEFAQAFRQTMGDQPYFPEVAQVFEGVSSFYSEAAEASIALFEDKEADAELAYIFGTTYHNLLSTLSSYLPSGPNTNLAQILPIETLPEADLAITEPSEDYQGAVSGAVLDVLPVNLERPWVTIQDNSTGQLYCLAIYNGEVNKYLGQCKNDYH